MHTLGHSSIRRLPEHWRWLGTRIRLGLKPDEPRLIAAYLETGRQACLADLLHPWQMSEQSFQTLLATALDRQLPWHWRTHCLNHAHQPLVQLERFAESRSEWRPQFVVLVQRLARAEMHPGDSLWEAPYGEGPLARRGS